MVMLGVTPLGTVVGQAGRLGAPTYDAAALAVGIGVAISMTAVIIRIADIAIIFERLWFFFNLFFHLF
jgi:hypothetical protein